MVELLSLLVELSSLKFFELFPQVSVSILVMLVRFCVLQGKLAASKLFGDFESFELDC